MPSNQSLRANLSYLPTMLPTILPTILPTMSPIPLNETIKKNI